MNTLQNADIDGKVVVVRCDMNVPLKEGVIRDMSRVDASMGTLKMILKKGAKRVHVLTHMGRPKGEKKMELSTRVLQKVLEEKLGVTVEFREDFTVGSERVQLHENVRFWPEEKKAPAAMGEKLMALAPELFVMDAFGTAHRGHGSVVGLAAHVETCAGLLMEREIEQVHPFLSEARVPGMTVIIGGAKMETKIEVLKHFAKTAENILIGGALANTFLAAQGYDVAGSLYEPDALETAQDILCIADAHKTGVHLPVDVICADDVHATQSLDVPLEDVCGGMKIFDLGPHTVASYKEVIAHSKMVLWNGPMGLFEFPLFAKGTEGILEALQQSEAQTVLGGGDTLAAMKQFGAKEEAFTHVSTGGGALLEFLEGKELPGVMVVMK